MLSSFNENKNGHFTLQVIVFCVHLFLKCKHIKVSRTPSHYQHLQSFHLISISFFHLVFFSFIFGKNIGQFGGKNVKLVKKKMEDWKHGGKMGLLSASNS